MHSLRKQVSLLKGRFKQNEKLYGFFWGLPIFRKTMSVYHNRLGNHLKKEGLSRGKVIARAADMVLSLWIYGCSYAEYNLYGFKDLRHRERRNYICDCCRKKYYAKLNSFADTDCFRDKYLAYQAFRPYYKRNAFTYRVEEGFERFREIVEICTEAMVKPADASGGYGIMKVSAAEPEMLRQCFDKISRIAPDGDIIIEEYVHQASALKALHPPSLNTARIITVVDRAGIPHIIGTLFRIGKDGTVVDNGASGGILCALSEDGTIQKSMDKKNNCFYKQHPNTGHPLVGFTIPRWSEAKALALELALEKPGIRYCGWDLALTDDGWIMIEGNEGAELAGIQIFGGGCKPSVERYL